MNHIKFHKLSLLPSKDQVNVKLDKSIIDTICLLPFFFTKCYEILLIVMFDGLFSACNEDNFLAMDDFDTEFDASDLHTEGRH